VSRDLLLLANIGAEEGSIRRTARQEAAVALVARLWHLLFGPGAHRAGAGCDWPAALGDRPDAPVFPWLDAPGAATAWLNDESAAAEAEAAGRSLTGPAPDIVRRVHDKAFALAAARDADLVPRALRDLVSVLEPDELLDPDGALRRIEARVAAWPAWAARDFTLKPRFGTSGRGRVSGRAAPRELRGALPRLAARGGAVLEPWLARQGDYSTQLRLDPDGGVVVLGTLQQLVTSAGLYTGHAGTVDHRGRVSSGSPWDEDLRTAGAAVGRSAAAEGFSGPCGIDAFCFAAEDGRTLLRPVVELNARFTTGTIAIGLVRRALPAIRSRLGLRPGDLHAFHLALEAPADGWPDAADEADLLLLPLWSDTESSGPALVVARDPAALAAWLATPERDR
jgi:hypothetical protein